MLTIHLDYKIVLFKGCVIYEDSIALVMVRVVWNNGGKFLTGDKRAARSATVSITHLQLVPR